MIHSRISIKSSNSTTTAKIKSFTVYIDEEVIENIRRNAWNISNDGVEMERDVPAVVIDVPENNDIVIDIEQPQQDDVEAQELQALPKSKKTLTAKNVKEKKRKLAFEVPLEEREREGVHFSDIVYNNLLLTCP